MNKEFMKLAICECAESSETDNFPVGCVLVCNNKVISKAHNSRNCSNITIDHAEISAIIAANKKLKSWRLDECDMYVTLEPCEMCKNVIKESRITNVYYLIERNPVKKICSKSKFIKHNQEFEEASKYIEKITTFFENKR